MLIDKKVEMEIEAAIRQKENDKIFDDRGVCKKCGYKIFDLREINDYDSCPCCDGIKGGWTKLVGKRNQ